MANNLEREAKSLQQHLDKNHERLSDNINLSFNDETRKAVIYDMQTGAGSYQLTEKLCTRLVEHLGVEEAPSETGDGTDDIHSYHLDYVSLMASLMELAMDRKERINKFILDNNN